MALRRMKAKVKETSGKLEALMRKGCASKADCVLVVYGPEAASIYYEGVGTVRSVAKGKRS